MIVASLGPRLREDDGITSEDDGVRSEDDGVMSEDDERLLKDINVQKSSAEITAHQ